VDNGNTDKQNVDFIGYFLTIDIVVALGTNWIDNASVNYDDPPKSLKQ